MVSKSDLKSVLSLQNLTDTMAAAIATNVTSSSSSTSTTTESSSLSASISTSSSTTTTTAVTATSTTICHNNNNNNTNNNNNFHELCRSCGKTNAELYDLFQTTNSPFNTSSTTCYTHLNNFTNTSSSACSSSTSSSSANKCSSSSSLSSSLTFDSLAATAKATAKGQSNMDNILQEMQIWQLMIKCNDGLPQRICAKCTAQFYMIHKFRRKCLKVQTQLRALNVEQKFYERQQQQQQQQKQQKDAIVTTPTAAAVASKCETLVEPNDLANDNCAGQQQQATVDNSKSSTSVSFETQTGNTEVEEAQDCKAPNNLGATTTLLDNVETMPQDGEKEETKTEALGCNDKSFAVATPSNCITTNRSRRSSCKPKDEKKPLLKAAVLKFRNTPPLTLQQPPLEQICDNDGTQQPTTTTASEKLKQCYDQEELLDTHIIFKTFDTTKTKEEEEECSLNDDEQEDEEMMMTLEDTPDTRVVTKKNLSTLGASNENLFLTKAALKAYTPTSNTNTTNSNDNNNNSNNPSINSSCPELSNKLLKVVENDSNDSNTCCSSISTSTTSNSTKTFYSSSSSSSSLSRKSLRSKIFKHKNIDKRSHHKYKSSAKLAIKKFKLKKTTRSWQNKHVGTCSATTAAAASAAGVNVRRKPVKLKKHKIYNKKKSQIQSADLQIDDETSSSVSTTSSATATAPAEAAMTTTSSSLKNEAATKTTRTSPAVTDLVVSNNCNNKTGFVSSKSQGISSNKYASCIMWKTKAAMKANANDMPTTLPYTANNDSATGLESAENTDKSSKTLDDNNDDDDENQSNISSSTNNFRQQSQKQKQNDCSTNTVMSLPPDNQVKDTEDEDESEQNLNHHNNLWPEKADQKQITNYQEKETTTEKRTELEQNARQTDVKEIEQTNEFSGGKDDDDDGDELPSEEKIALNATTTANKIGGMKLIIQRKRGARFKCRRKSEDEPFSEVSKPKRRKKSKQNHTKYEIESIFSVDLNAEYRNENKLDLSRDSDMEEETIEMNSGKRHVPDFNSAGDENKENPISLHHLQECDSDSNTSVYRDPLLIRNDMLEEDTHLTDFPKPQLSLQSECSKEMYKLYKEKVNLESPKKLIIRVPLTSLTQDFKRLHLTMETESQENEEEQVGEILKPEKRDEEGEEEEVEENQEQQPVEVEVNNEIEQQEEKEAETENQITTEQLEDNTAHTMQITSTQTNNNNNTGSSSQSDFLGFSQNTETCTTSSTVDSSCASSSQPSVDMFRYVQQPLCSASSKINEFINDFQNNCIDSSEIDETCDMVPQLGPRITQELSDEIRDVEDTLNGILSEMHDKDMYTPRSAETDDLFPHSVYSPLTDSPTTPSHSFYAESPCTINSNPMSVSPFIHQNMDYNAMTPQSNHSSSMGHSSHMGGCGSSVSGGSTGPHTTGVFSEHFPTYNECFEESTQSELIGFQNDIPCFENIEISNQANNADLLGNPTEFNEEEEMAETDVNVPHCNTVETGVEGVKSAPEIVEYIDLSDYKENNDHHFANAAVQEETVPDIAVTNADLLTQQMPYGSHNYPTSLQMQHTTNPLIPGSANTQPHYIVTNTNQGPILIANPHQLNQTSEQMEGAFKAHSNNLQFVTLGQAMEAANQAPMKHMLRNNAQEINWPTATQNYGPQPVISTTNGTTTYFINANGELYQASIPTPALNTIIMPNNNSNQAHYNKTNMETNDNYMQTLQQQQQHQQQSNANAPTSSQYIMLVNNLGGPPQYYTTTQAVPQQQQQPAQQQQPQQQTVLFQRNSSTNYHLTNSKTSNNSSHERTNPPLAPKPTTTTTNTPISPALEKDQAKTSAPSMRQRVNQQLQQQIKQRQLQLLQPRSANVTQKITLICRFCHKRPKFTNNVDYSNHIINMHPAEKPYNCPHCPMHFSRRFERQQHVAQVHGSRYQCAQCGLSFCAQRTLDFHLQKYHANLGRSQQHLRQQQQQQNSTSTSTSPATYQLLQQHNQQQRLVRVEDVHVQVTGENKNKRSIDLPLEASTDTQTSPSMPEVEILSETPTGTPQHRSQARILCSPDCNDDNDDCCGSNQNSDQTNNNNNTEEEQQHQQYTGNESVNNNHHHHHQQQQQHQHVTIPSPEQTEPDSTTTLRHFRKRHVSEISPHFAASPSSSSTYNFNNNNGHSNNDNNININHNSPDNVLTDDAGAGAGGVGCGGEQIMVERTLRGSHNCLLCEESFTNEIALRKHHHLAHGATQTNNSNNTFTTSSSSSSSALVCTICKRGFRMRNALQRHMETHDAEGRPYECNICQVRFPRPSQLTLHKLTVHKFEKPNSCEECGKQFGTETAMKAHAKEHEEEAANANTASEALTSTASSSSTTPASQLSSRIYLETMTTKTTSTIITNEQTINLLATTSGEDETTVAATNNNEDDNTVFNNNTIVSGLTT